MHLSLAAGVRTDKPRVPAPRRGAALLGIFAMLIQAVLSALRFKPDVVVCGHPVDGLIGICLHRLLGIPYVVITHSMELRNPRLRPMLPRVFASAACVVCNSEYTRAEVRISPLAALVAPSAPYLLFRSRAPPRA